MAARGAYALARRAIDLVDDALMVLGCAMLFALMLVVVADVSLRYLANAPLQWSYEVVSSYLMPGLFFLAVSHTLKSNAHVSVDILHNHVSRTTRYVFETVCTLAALPVFAICAWVAARHTWSDFQSAATSTSGLGVPTWTVSILLPIGFGLLSLRLLLNAVGYVATLATRRELVPLPPISGTQDVPP